MLQKIAEILADKFGVEVDTITPETKIKEDLDADSLDLVELIMEVEENFDVTIDEEAATKMSTVADIMSYIEKA